MDIVTTFFLSALAQQGLRVYTDFWLQSWTERTQQQSFDNRNRVDPAEVSFLYQCKCVPFGSGFLFWCSIIKHALGICVGLSQMTTIKRHSKMYEMQMQRGLCFPLVWNLNGMHLLFAQSGNAFSFFEIQTTAAL